VYEGSDKEALGHTPIEVSKTSKAEALRHTTIETKP
jgi:hypothetical protein